MLIQNQYDGRLYEVPEGTVAGYGEYPGQEGLGIPFLAPLAARAAARFLPKAIPFARRLLSRGGIPGVPVAPAVSTARLSTRIAEKVAALLRQQGVQTAPTAASQPQPAGGPPPAGGEPEPAVGEYPYYGQPRPYPAAWPQRPYPPATPQRPWPQQPYPSPYMPGPPGARWVVPNAQYPSTGARRLYLRCSSWWGPRGRVPGPGMAVQPGQPGVPQPPFAPATATPPTAPYQRRRYRRR
ncbi:MAG: hypothetical protein ACKV22_40095 [Bryobacteraceae bacterium]